MRNQPRTTREDLVNDLKAAGTIVTKKTIGNTQRCEGLKSCSKVPLLKKAYVQARLKFNNEVLWSNETKIELFGIKGNAAYDSKNTSPLSNIEMETLCFGGVFMLRGQDKCTASKGRWSGHLPSGH